MRSPKAPKVSRTADSTFKALRLRDFAAFRILSFEFNRLIFFRTRLTIYARGREGKRSALICDTAGGLRRIVAL